MKDVNVYKMKTTISNKNGYIVTAETFNFLPTEIKIILNSFKKIQKWLLHADCSFMYTIICYFNLSLFVSVNLFQKR